MKVGLSRLPFQWKTFEVASHSGGNSHWHSSLWNCWQEKVNTALLPLLSNLSNLSCNLCLYSHTSKCTFSSVGRETQITRKLYMRFLLSATLVFILQSIDVFFSIADSSLTSGRMMWLWLTGIYCSHFADALRNTVISELILFVNGKNTDISEDTAMLGKPL